MKKITFWSIIWGLLFIASAGLIILHLFGLLGEINTWTLILTVPIAVGAIACAIKFAWFGMFILLGAMALIYRDMIQEILGIEYTLSTVLLIVALLSIGFHILFRQKKLWKTAPSVDWNMNQTIENAEGEKVYFEEKYGGSSKYINSDNLSYVGISNHFGGMEVHFTNAVLSDEGAVANIDNSFGGLELVVPQSWNIVNQINDYFASTDFCNPPYTEGAPTLTLRGVNKFGGVNISRV